MYENLSPKTKQNKIGIIKPAAVEHSRLRQEDCLHPRAAGKCIENPFVLVLFLYCYGKNTMTNTIIRATSFCFDF